MLGDFFDPKADFFIEERIKPHWTQTSAIVFGTFRTLDSIPKQVLQRWEQEKKEWILRAIFRGCNTGYAPVQRSLEGNETVYLSPTILATLHWSKLLEFLSEVERVKFNSHFGRCRETKLDECLGECVLRNPELSKIVADSLMHFDQERYRMGDFIVMPNHVHLLVVFKSPEMMKAQFASWLRYTAKRINKLIGRVGHFWQQEPFDHLVRNLDQYKYLRRYIADNPKKAGLNSGEYFYRRFE